MHLRPAISRSNVRSAFTLIEIMVVLIIISILAAMFVPKLTGNEKRQFRMTVDQVADLLTVYAQRESNGQKVVGLQFDPGRMELALVEIDTDNSRPGIPADWKVDHNVAPVHLPSFMRPEDLMVYADGQLMDITSWPLSTTIGQDRPQVEVTLTGAD